MPRADATTALPLSPVTLDPQLDVETPELVLITYTIAGIGSRTKAAVIDLAITIGMWIAVVVAYLLLGPHNSFIAAWATAILIILQFAIIFGYYIAMEGLRDGQTIGKKIVGIRVVREGGYSVAFGASAARNILRLIDFQPVGMPAVGLVTMMFSPTGKRVGDIVAGTIVVREQNTRAIAPPRRWAAAAGTVQAPAGPVLTDDEFALLDRYIQRRVQLPPEQRNRMVAALAQRFRGRIKSEAAQGSVFLVQLYEVESLARRTGRGSRNARGAARERHAIVSEGKARWAAFAARLSEIQKMGMEKLTDKDLTSFVSSYRETAGDLARLRTASRNADPADVFYLSRIVASGHNLFYRAGRDEMSAFFNFLFAQVPREVRRSWRAILLAAILFYGPAVTTYLALREHPERTTSFVSPAMISRAEDGAERARKGTGYIEDPKDARPVMGSFVMTNNIKVALLAFAAGVTLVGTPLILLFNAVSIGAVLALYANKGVFPLIEAFIIPHSVLELTAIVIAGAAGLLLAGAILTPGRQTRKDALVAAAKRSLRLVSCSTLFLVFAGMLEGFVSPNPHIAVSWKIAAAALSAIGAIAFVSLGTGATEAPAP